MTLTRRDFVRRTAAGTSLAMSARLLPRTGTPAARAGVPVALPSAGQILEDYQRMVDFGPRLTGTPSHGRFIDWVQDELERAGCLIYPRDDKPFTYWNAERWGLELLDGPAPGPVKISSYFPRSGETPPAGITGRLVSALRVDEIAGNIVLIEPHLPAPLTEALFAAMASAYHWPGHPADLLRDYKRVWLATIGPDTALETYRKLGAAGAVFVLDASAAAAAGAYLPFNTGFSDCPALWVDRETGAALSHVARTSSPAVRLTLTAEKRRTTSPSIVGVLPGTSDEVLVVNTHTDGQNAFEENAAVGLVHLARYFGSLPPERRLKRSIVFSAVTGHMTQELPQTQGFVDDHPDLIAAAAAGMTIEHLGCTEWVDGPSGFHATGDPEMCGLWTSQSGVATPAARSLSTDEIPHTYVLRPVPLYLGIGEPLYSAGVPGVSFISGPSHLVNIVPNGHIDKLDPALAARQTRWAARLVTTFDGMTAATMMAGDSQLMRPRLGVHKPFPPARATCLPARSQLTPGGAGPVQVGATREQLRSANVRPTSTRRDVFRFCVDQSSGRVSAVVDADQVRLVTSTLPADRGSLALFPRRRRIATGLFRTAPDSQTVIGVRRRHVRFAASADRATVGRTSLLKRLLRRAGL